MLHYLHKKPTTPSLSLTWAFEVSVSRFLHNMDLNFVFWTAQLALTTQVIIILVYRAPFEVEEVVKIKQILKKKND